MLPHFVASMCVVLPLLLRSYCYFHASYSCLRVVGNVQIVENNGNCCKLKKVELYISVTGERAVNTKY